MAGAVQHAEGVLADGHLVALHEPAVGHHVAGVGHAEALSLLGEPLEQEQIALIRPFDRDRRGGLARFSQPLLEPLLELRGTAGMVDVAVGQEDLLDPDALLLDRLEDALDLAARVDHRPAPARLLPEQRAVLLEGRHRDDGGLERHGSSSEVAGPALNLRTDRRAVKLLGAANVRLDLGDGSSTGPAKSSARRPRRQSRRRPSE